ncbi:MAG TPA: AAA family ATPase [Candidatus Sumerlaeota bacterium]|nr:AAA family ATPase [Candidatus Sumerlaeota bacterium]HRR30117.1 AAA family ATPase [Candidatus Sumerlaeia bacterium]HON49778.1 AAA family ATPase [Candidatus Sumerlaeota bacterium]HOR63974.1 AAA family ATPase [Candidatus Sumerlaeota bacterium]HPL75194.1 AAA family ATPase [Candidatus Sumerlaeota bacterium]
MHIDEFLARLERAKPAPGGWLARCPAHGDRRPSLSIAFRNGKILLKCHAGCTSQEIVRAMRLTMKDLFFEPSANAPRFADAAPPRAASQTPATPAAPPSLRPAEHAPAIAPPPAPERRHFWQTAQEALTQYGALPKACEDAEAIEFLRSNHGIEPEHIPHDWKVLRSEGYNGIVYLALDIGSAPICFFYGSFERGGNGKRKKRFLFHDRRNPCVQYYDAESATLVICHGAEKTAAARAAGHNAFGLLTGEGSAIPPPWLDYFLKKLVPEKIILANDNDETGRRANLETAQALEDAGFDASRLFIVRWDESDAKGRDLNDVLKERGLKGLQEFLDKAPPYESPRPRALSLGGFITAARPPLRFHIEGILPVQGKLTFSATSKFGKSMWAIQTGMALAAGDCKWLGFQFGKPARVLYLQAEIADSLLEARLKAVLQTLPQAINRERALANLFIQETAKARPNLATPEGRQMTEALIARIKPEALILDPLAAVCPGLEENSAESMGAALYYFSELSSRHTCAIILIHHHGKGGISRGSSVYEAWSESDLQAARIEDDPDVCRVDMRLRCVFNEGPRYWVMPAPERLWFADLPDYEPEKKLGGRPSKLNEEQVRAVLGIAGRPMSWTELHRGLKNISGCVDSTASDAINRAKDRGIIKKDGNFYALSITPKTPPY